MFRLFILFSFLTITAKASHLDTVCESAMKFTPFFTDSLVARTTPEHRHVIEDFSGKIIYEHSERIYSVVARSEKMWALTDSEILEMDLAGNLIKKHSLSMNKSMALAGDMLLVVRSGGTVSALNTLTGEIAWTSYMQDVPGALAVAIAFDGVNAQVIMSTAHQDGFTGVATINPQTGVVLKATPYNVLRFGVIAPNANARWYDGKLVINNSGWIHVLTKKQLDSGKPMRPKWVAHVVTPDSNPHYMMLKGNFFFEGSKLVGCGTYHDSANPDWNLKSGLFKVQMP